MKVLFIGGTGKISSACSPLAVERGIDLYLLNRGQTERPIPEGAHLLQGNIRDKASVEAALQDHTFDAVVNWIAFTPDQIETDIELFSGRTGQYVFISSASAYQSPPVNLPATESTPLDNPYWLYSRNKIACEERLMQEYRTNKFPITIVRPSHTYDQTLLPMQGGWTAIDRMRKGQKILIHAGAGGVGHFALQLARWKGARVITTASAKNRDHCLAFGADEVIDYRNRGQLVLFEREAPVDQAMSQLLEKLRTKLEAQSTVGAMN